MMMVYSINDGEVFCPITMVTAQFKYLSTLFRASHIKSFSECEDHEKFDINNGLLLTASIDALFDKHLFSINHERQLVFSFLLEKNHVLKSKLLLNQSIFLEIFNSSRMKYIKYHYQKFLEKEQNRKENKNFDFDS